MKLVVAQLGARRHYAIPRMLHDAGMLSHLYTDICAVKGWPQLLQLLPAKYRPNGVKRLLGRIPLGVPKTSITAFTGFGWKLSSQLRHIKSRAEIFSVLVKAGEEFCGQVLKHGLDNATGVYTFNGAGLQLLQYARSRGLRTIMEQTIAPMASERQLLQEEQQRFPAWQDPEPNDEWVQRYIEREQAEWEASDVILCGSEFVRDGISACGGPKDRCVVVPFGLDVGRFSIPARPAHEGPLRVLTVGAVGLRKGSPYVLEVAKQLKDKAIFRMVGPLTTPADINAQLAQHIELVGPVPRSAIREHFAWADVFFLPSLCEGSATSTYEALAAGLPTICTPNTGSIVRDGIDGYVVENRNIEGFIAAINGFVKNDGQLKRMSSLAVERSMEFTLDRYQNRLLEAIVAKE